MAPVVTMDTSFEAKPFIISSAKPRPDDLKKTKELEKVLESFNIFDTDSDLKRRENALQKLDSLAKKWVYDFSVDNNIPAEKARKFGGKVCSFGSYLLGVHHKDADIDAIFIAPRNIERKDFFSKFSRVLEEQPEISECRSIEEAFVPVMKMMYDDIEIDLLFARLGLEEIPDDFELIDDNLLANLDMSSVRSLNGRRNSIEILKLVPNVNNFKIALRTIKLWAKENGVYSNSLGYLGGISWAILVARICQLYPNAAASTLIEKFFVVYSNWNWSKPILIKERSHTNLGFQVWDPRRNIQDRYHLMPIITPSYPEQNSTFNVSTSTKKVIVDEICRAASVMDAIALGKASWDRLFKGPGFFHRYRHFMVLMAKADNMEDYKKWRGFIESKVRYFLGELENHFQIMYPRLYPKCFEVHGSTSQNGGSPSVNGSDHRQYSGMWFFGLEFVRNKNLYVNLYDMVLYFVDTIYLQAEELKLLNPNMSVELRHVKHRDLKCYLSPKELETSKQRLKEYNDFTGTILNLKRRLSTELVQQKVKRIRLNNNVAITPNYNHC